jgi:LmbE family N-acetylglucosaminyl deacetylase
MRLLLISPHFDDAFLSAVGLVLRHGAAVTIAYPFHSPAATRTARWRREEAHNVRRFGCTPRFLAARPPAPTAGWLDAGGGAARRTVEALARTLAGAFHGGGYHRIVAPLGIGLHRDHVACAEAVLHAASTGRIPARAIRFYSDLPYAVAYPLLRGRMLHLAPRRWLRPRATRVPARLKLAVVRRYASQFVPGVVEGIVARATPAAVTLARPLARPLTRGGTGTYECYWRARATPGGLLRAARAPLPAPLDEFQRETLPLPDDDVPFFDRRYRDAEARWSRLITRLR